MKTIVLLAVTFTSLSVFGNELTSSFQDYAVNGEQPYAAYRTRVPHRQGPRTKWRQAVRFLLDGSRAICSGETYREIYPLFNELINNANCNKKKIGLGSPLQVMVLNCVN